MPAKSSSREVIWIAVGGLGLLALFFTVLYFRAERDPAAQIASKEKRVALVNAMRLDLAAASEAQNSVVMSTGEQDSKAFAEQARAATADLERGRTELEKLLQERGGSNEVQLMERVAQALLEFQQVDKQLLELAVQSSNRKAYGLAFGPAMKLLQEMDAALARIVAEHSSPPSENNMQVLQLTSDVRIGILHIQVLLLPHIAEPDNRKMDEFEVQLSAEDRMVREKLASLDTLLAGDKSSLEIVTARYAEFEKLRSQILKLSRENTDIRAVAIALNEKRKVMLACQDALVALERAIQAEPITTTIPSGRSPAVP